MKILHDIVIKFNHWRSKSAPVVRPDELLLLLPHCLQFNNCEQNIKNNPDSCKRCGKCPFKDLLELQEQYGFKMIIASGGRQAVAEAKSDAIKAVVAVACEKELCAGIMAIFPKKVKTITNQRPQGPCKNTDVDIAEVEKKIREVLGLD